MKRIAKLIILLSIPAFLAGCNTVSGFGQDVKDGSQAVSHMINGKKSDSSE